MAYARISHTRNGRQALQYVLEGPPHDDAAEARNLYVTSVGLLPPETESYYDQCERIFSKASSRNKNQIRRVIVSFSENELDPDDPNAPFKAAEIGTRIAEEGYPGFPCLIAVSNDGHGHKLHLHACFANVNVLDNNKGFSDDQTKHWYLKQVTDKVCQDYFELDDGRKAKDKVTQSERRKREENEQIKKDNKNLPADQQKPLKYIWKDDLKSRIKDAMREATDRDDYLSKLTLHGVEGEYKSTKKNGDFILYELTDVTNFPENEKIPANLKSKSYKLGADFGIEALDRQLGISAPEPTPEIRPGSLSVDKTKTGAGYTSRYSYSNPNSDAYKGYKPLVSPDEDLVDHEADQKMRQEFHEFYMWCRENNMTFGSGDTFDQEKHDEARRLYAEHLYRQKHPEEFASEPETPEPEVSEPETPAIEEPSSPEEEPEPVHKKHGGKKSKEETEQVTTETAPTQEETLEESPSRNPRLQAMIDALQHDFEMAEQGHEDAQDSDEFGG